MFEPKGQRFSLLSLMIKICTWDPFCCSPQSHTHLRNTTDQERLSRWIFFFLSMGLFFFPFNCSSLPLSSSPPDSCSLFLPSLFSSSSSSYSFFFSSLFLSLLYTKLVGSSLRVFLPSPLKITLSFSVISFSFQVFYHDSRYKSKLWILVTVNHS